MEILTSAPSAQKYCRRCYAKNPEVFFSPGIREADGRVGGLCLQCARGVGHATDKVGSLRLMWLFTGSRASDHQGSKTADGEYLRLAASQGPIGARYSRTTGLISFCLAAVLSLIFGLLTNSPWAIAVLVLPAIVIFVAMLRRTQNCIVSGTALSVLAQSGTIPDLAKAAVAKRLKCSQKAITWGELKEALRKGFSQQNYEDSLLRD